MRHRTSLAIVLAVLTAIVVLIAVVTRQGSVADKPALARMVARPQGVMGTRAELTAIVRADQLDLARRALHLAENRLRGVEALMSRYIEFSEVSRLNAVSEGQSVQLSEETLEVLTAARKLTEQTLGAFDPTFAPVFALWAKCGRQDPPRVPTADELAAARKICGWKHFQSVGTDRVKKITSKAAIDLGGIAKGYALDEAAEAMRTAGVVGALVNVGGDIRCLGSRGDGTPWRVEVRNPFRSAEGAAPLAVLRVSDGAVCTSGNYERGEVIHGRRHSHIKDPRTGLSVDSAPSVTVIADNATTADGWATALSVLGPDGLDLIPAKSNIQVMVVFGTADEHRFRKTPGFDAFLEGAEAASSAPVAAAR